MMKRLGRLLTGVVMLAAILLLAACSGGSSAKKSAAAPVKKITLFQSKVEITDDLKALAKEYKKQTGVTVEIWGTTGDDYITQAKTRLANKASGPSIFSSAGGLEADQLKSYMADLSNAPFTKNIAENKAYKIGNKVLGLPYSVEGYGLIVNTALVDPATLNSPTAFINFLNKSKADGKFSGFELSQESYFLIGHMLNTAFALQPDSRQFVTDVDSGKTKLQNVKEFQDLGKIYEAIRTDTPNPLQVNYDKQIGDLMTGKVATINQGMWINSLTAGYKNSTAKLEMVPFPFAGNTKLAVDVPQFWHVNGTKSKGEIKAATAFLNWMVSSKIGKDYIVNKFKFIPAMTNIKLDPAKTDPLTKAVYDAAQSGDNIPWSFPYWPFGIVDTNLVPVVQKFFTDKSMTGQQLMTQLSAAFVTAAKAK